MNKTRILVLYYSMHGNIFQTAQAIMEGAGKIPKAEMQLRQVQELLPKN